jgi:GntR family transcriptional regulator, transcriptional repressor for pyruvate dehydrogenase complex
MATKVTTLTDQVAQRMQEAIQQGVYAVGAKLPSGRELGKIYGVSQAVIREVTERLRSQGLIDSRQGSGCIVKSRTEVMGFRISGDFSAKRDGLSSVFELRLDLEGAAAALAAVRRDDADIDALEAILDRLASNLYDLDAGVELDIAFHTAVASATHNPHYVRLLNYLNLQLRQAVHAARYNALTHAPLPETVQREHIAIYEAIRARDPEAARAAAISHLQEAAVHLALDIPLRDTTTGTIARSQAKKLKKVGANR